MHTSLQNPGVRAGLASAVLFGASTPLAKPFTAEMSPWMIAGLLYLGSGIGIYAIRAIRGKFVLDLPRENRGSLFGAVFVGGVIAPVLLMFGLTGIAASDASLLLNTEVIFTAVIAWVVFKENFDMQILLGMVAIVIGAVVLSFQGFQWESGALPGLAVLGACLFWGIDNNLTRNVSGGDALSIASFKGLVAGPTNLGLAFALGAQAPRVLEVISVMGLGLACYGVSLVLFILALRHIGTARAGAYFSVAPFFGAVLALIMGSALTWNLVVAGIVMGLGVVLHLVERHEHEHSHGDLVHTHAHFPDLHHRHKH